MYHWVDAYLETACAVWRHPGELCGADGQAGAGRPHVPEPGCPGGPPARRDRAPTGQLRAHLRRRLPGPGDHRGADAEAALVHGHRVRGHRPRGGRERMGPQARRPSQAWTGTPSDGWTGRPTASKRTLLLAPHAATAEAARREIFDSKRRLEDALSREVPVFSYPHGEDSPREEALVAEAGCRCAVTDDRGLNRAGVPPSRVKRVMVTSEDGPLGFVKARTARPEVRRAPAPGDAAQPRLRSAPRTSRMTEAPSRSRWSSAPTSA